MEEAKWREEGEEQEGKEGRGEGKGRRRDGTTPIKKLVTGLL